MTTTDYFLATPAELTKACRGWVPPGSPPNENAATHAEYFELPWADLKSIDQVVLEPLAAIVLGVNEDAVGNDVAPSLKGPSDCEQYLVVLFGRLVRALADLSDDQLPGIVTEWLVPLRTDTSSIQVATIRDLMLSALTKENYLPVLITLRKLARQATESARGMYMLMAP